jgi:hypothetical protein
MNKLLTESIYRVDSKKENVVPLLTEEGSIYRDSGLLGLNANFDSCL